jgi:hypothetical protein
MAAKRLTLEDLLFGKPPYTKSSRAQRFDELNQPFVFKYQPGLSERQVISEAATARRKHREKMLRLLLEKAGLLTSKSPRLAQYQSLLHQIVDTYVPAFGETELVPAKRPPGRPSSGLTAREKSAIDKAVKEDGQSVRQACQGLAWGKGKAKAKKVEAMAAAYRRATKTGMRRN